MKIQPPGPMETLSLQGAEVRVSEAVVRFLPGALNRGEQVLAASAWPGIDGSR